MNILVCGGLGFKGCNFIMHMLDKYSDCFILNLDQETENSNLEFKFLGDYYKNYMYIKGNIGDRALVKEILRKYDISKVVNLAELSDSNSENGDEFIHNNTVSLYNLLAECKEYSVDRFIQISSAQVYGSVLNGDASEESLLKPGNLYAASKAAGDLLCMSFYNLYGFPVTIVRTGNVFGIYQSKKEFIPMVINKAAAGKKIPILGDGLSIREWLYVIDFNEVIDRILKVGRSGQIYNLAGDHRKTAVEIVELILDYLKIEGNPIYYKSERIGFDRKRTISTDKLKKEILWKPKYGFHKALNDTVSWYIKNIE